MDTTNPQSEANSASQQHSPALRHGMRPRGGSREYAHTLPRVRTFDRDLKAQQSTEPRGQSTPKPEIVKEAPKPLPTPPNPTLKSSSEIKQAPQNLPTGDFSPDTFIRTHPIQEPPRPQKPEPPKNAPPRPPDTHEVPQPPQKTGKSSPLPHLHTYEKDVIKAGGTSPHPPKKPITVSKERTAEPGAVPLPPVVKKDSREQKTSSTKAPFHTYTRDVDHAQRKQDVDAQKQTNSNIGESLKREELSALIQKKYHQPITEKAPLDPKKRILPRRPIPQTPPPQPEVPKKPPSAKGSSKFFSRIMHPLRTYDADLATHVKNEKASRIKIALTEQSIQARREAYAQNKIPIPPQKKKKISADTYPFEVIGNREQRKRHAILPTLIISIALMVVGGGIAYGGYRIANRMPQTVTFDTGNILITETSRKIQNENLKPSSVQEIIENLSIGNDAIVHLYSTRTTPEGVEFFMPSSTFISTLAPEIPGILARSLKPEFTFGVYGHEGDKEAFLVLKTNSYPHALGGMLQWEASLPKSISGLFGNLTTTQNSFTDMFIKNRDVRVLYGDNEEMILLYSFIDKQTLIIAQSELVFLEILTRQ